MPERSLRDDDRGLAIAVVMFIAMIVIGALLYAVMDAALADVFTVGRGLSTSSGASDSIDLWEAIWNNLLFAVLVISALFLVARAVAEARRA